jgi:hypothetical protein
MSYRSWFKEHGLRHRAIVDRLLDEGYSQKEIIDYFDFDNMMKAEPQFCRMYEKKKKCHDIKTLNCYLCACPFFRFNDDTMGTVNGKPQYSCCSINSSKGKLGTYGEKVHQDCNGCVVPHKPSFVAKHFDRDWFVPMTGCDVGEASPDLRSPQSDLT